MKSYLHIFILLGILIIFSKLKLSKCEHRMIEWELQLIKICIFDGIAFIWQFFKYINFTISYCLNRFITPHFIWISLVKNRVVILSHSHYTVKLLQFLYFKFLYYLLLFFSGLHMNTFSFSL